MAWIRSQKSIANGCQEYSINEWYREHRSFPTKTCLHWTKDKRETKNVFCCFLELCSLLGIYLIFKTLQFGKHKLSVQQTFLFSFPYHRVKGGAQAGTSFARPLASRPNMRLIIGQGMWGKMVCLTSWIWNDIVTKLWEYCTTYIVSFLFH